mmetsp:Transcript_63644/g.175585  ORF Transcript_63644/g.175585 Transcript_63644/m.175585 type:complete len:271 (+) Transcript_63644:215-1027(+)
MQLHPGMSWREREAAKKEYFDKYVGGFTSSTASLLANKEGVCSTTPHLQQHYIRTAEHISNEEHIRSRPRSPQATPDIQAVIKLQDRLGRWDQSEALWGALGGHVPEPPYGIVGWRWATALAVAYMRRSPEQQHFCEQSYSKAQEWLQPPWLLKSARDALPPKDCYFELDEEAVKKGEPLPSLPPCGGAAVSNIACAAYGCVHSRDAPTIPPPTRRHQARGATRSPSTWARLATTTLWARGPGPTPTRARAALRVAIPSTWALSRDPRTR